MGRGEYRRTHRVLLTDQERPLAAFHWEQMPPRTL